MSNTKDVDGLVNFLEWLDGERVVHTWRDNDETHEDVAKAYLEAKNK
ncbi:hypothetical protein SEA_LUCKYLEO_92 [Gordonia phage LuckyLeo]|nr:hypothetical protein SEA_LUCKYLEO_92 [Gordonia phage LuckyLeo]